MKEIIMTYIDYVSKVSTVDDFKWLETNNERLKKENNINYLGELLERWESREFKYLDILKYAAVTSNIEHNTNQVDNFIELTEKIIFDKEFTLVNLDKELNQEYVYVYLYMVKNLKPEYLLNAYEKFLNFYKGIDVVFMEIVLYFTTNLPIISETLLNKKHPLRAQLISFIKENKIDLIKFIGARRGIEHNMMYTLDSNNIDCIIYKYFSAFVKTYSITKKELGEKEFEGYRKLKHFGQSIPIEEVDECVFLFTDREVAFLTNLLMGNARYSAKSNVKYEKIDYLKGIASSVLKWNSPILQHVRKGNCTDIGISLGNVFVDGYLTRVFVPINIQDCNSNNCDIELFSDFIFNYYGCYNPYYISLDILCNDIFVKKLENYIEINKEDCDISRAITIILESNLVKLKNNYPSNAELLLKYLEFFKKINRDIDTCMDDVYLWAILNGIIIIESEAFTSRIKETLIRKISRNITSKLDNGYETVVKELIKFAIQTIEQSGFSRWTYSNEYSFLKYLLTCKSIHLEKEDLINIQTVFIKSRFYCDFLDELILNSNYCEMLGITEENMKELFLYLANRNEEKNIENLNKKFINLDVYEKRKAIESIEDSLKSLEFMYDFKRIVLTIEKNQSLFSPKEIEEIKYKFILKLMPKIEKNFIGNVRLLIKHNYISTATAQKWLHIMLEKGELHE